MSKFLKTAEKSKSVNDSVLTCIHAGFYFTDYAMKEKRNLETAYGAMVFREVLHGPHFRVATHKRNGKFVASRGGPRIADVIDGFERAIAILYGSHVLDRQEKWLNYYCDVFSHLLEQYRLGIVTTNYDLVAEIALNHLKDKGGPPTSYCFQADWGLREYVPILKLHGSVNWPKSGDLNLRDVPTDAPPLAKAYVLPPTWNKDLATNRVFGDVWTDAVDLIVEAEEILVIGQSFPKTDLHLGYLFAEALSKRTGQEQRRVTIVDANKKIASTVCARFKKYQTVREATAYKVPFKQLKDALVNGLLNSTNP